MIKFVKADDIEFIKADDIDDLLIEEEGEAPESWRELLGVKILYYIEGDGFFAIMDEDRVVNYGQNLIETNKDDLDSRPPLKACRNLDQAVKTIRWAGEEIFQIVNIKRP